MKETIKSKFTEGNEYDATKEVNSRLYKITDDNNRIVEIALMSAVFEFEIINEDEDIQKD